MRPAGTYLIWQMHGQKVATLFVKKLKTLSKTDIFNVLRSQGRVMHVPRWKGVPGKLLLAPMWRLNAAGTVRKLLGGL